MIGVCLSIGLFAGIIPTLAFARLSGTAFCAFCLTFWSSVAIALAIDSVEYHGVRFFIIAACLTGAATVYVFEKGDSHDSLRRQLLQRVFEWSGATVNKPVAVRRIGQHFQGPLKHGDGIILIATKCTPCTNSNSGKILRSAGVTQERLRLLQPDGSLAWSAPPGYENSQRIVDEPEWSRLLIPEHGTPSIVRIKDGLIEEVLQ